MSRNLFESTPQYMKNRHQESPEDPSLIQQLYVQSSSMNINMDMNGMQTNISQHENTTTTISSSSSRTGNQSNDENHEQLHHQQQQHYHPLHGNVMAVPMQFPQHIFPIVQQPHVHAHDDRDDSSSSVPTIATGNNLNLSTVQPHFPDMAALGAAAALPYNYLAAGAAAAADPVNGLGGTALNSHLHQHGPGHLHDPTTTATATHPHAAHHTHTHTHAHHIVDPSITGHGHNHGHTHAGHDDNHDNMDLLNLVLAYDWPAALARISSHPSEATSVGVQGRTPLHVACDQDAPAVVIQALLKANPMASTMVGTSDMNPLHITCSCQHASVEVVRVLLDSHNLQTNAAAIHDGIGGGNGDGSDRSDNNVLNQNYNRSGHDRIVKVTSMKDVDGDTPLHAACRCGAPIDVLEELLKANPAAVHDRDYEGLTPLLRLWVRYFVTLGDDVINGVANREDVKGELAEAWRKTEVLLKASYHGSIRVGTELESRASKKAMDHVNEMDNNNQSCATEKKNPETKGGAQSRKKQKQFHTLHAASAVDCPRAVVKIATILYPNQLEEFDTTHRTPLMIASLVPIFKEHDLSGEGYYLDEIIHGDEENDEDNDNGNVNDSNANASNRIGNDEYLSPSTEQKQPTVLQILLEAGADARRGHRQLNRKRIPLHHALANGKRWHEGIKLLRNAYPDGLIKVDTQTGLYAFMLAAANDDDQNGGMGKKVVEDSRRKTDLDTVYNLLRSRPEALLLRDDKVH